LGQEFGMAKKTKISKSKKSKWKKALKIAQLAAMEAGDFALEQFTKIHVYKEKPMTKDVVTAVDIECEKRIVKILRKNFPSHTLLTEERLLPKNPKSYSWWIDPLDGSISYIFNLPYWGISLALIHNGKPVVGVCYFPQSRNMFWATKGEGAYLNYKKIKVASINKLVDGVIGIDYGYREEREEGVEKITLRLSDEVKYLVTYACTVRAIALVAEGKLVSYIHHMARRFDLAAGALLVTEAGGKVSDSKGMPINWYQTKPVHFVCTNGEVHKELITKINE
jgi:myo-inositol-1(or 4)-monophosphatase